MFGTGLFAPIYQRFIANSCGAAAALPIGDGITDDTAAIKADAQPPALDGDPESQKTQMALRQLNTLSELDELMARGSALGNEQARVAILVEHVVRDQALMPNGHDPFSENYREWVKRTHAHVSGRSNYDPARDELIPIDPRVRAIRPGIYLDGGSKHLGMFLEAFGQILQVADVNPGARVLEYGPGDGQLALAFARMACDVTVVDIEPKYLETIALQAKALGITVNTVHGEFGMPLPDGAAFDLVVFFETFHHVLDHSSLLRALRDRVADSGKIIFAGEPIIPEGDYWAPVVPFPWGLRLDALSLSAVRHYGWMELGFQESYFLELLRRTGWRCEKRTSPSNGRGTCYVATRA